MGTCFLVFLFPILVLMAESTHRPFPSLFCITFSTSLSSVVSTWLSSLPAGRGRCWQHPIGGGEGGGTRVDRPSHRGGHLRHVTSRLFGSLSPLLGELDLKFCLCWVLFFLGFFPLQIEGLIYDSICCRCLFLGKNFYVFFAESVVFVQW